MIIGLVSTIIPVFNRPRQLREAVASVLEQDYRPIEIIIVDDGSSDETLEVALSLQNGNAGIIRVISQTNGGAGLARECGRKQARGEFIQYLDSDDILLPGKFKAQVEALNSCPDCDVAYGMTRYRYRDGMIAPSPWKGSGEQRTTMFPSFLVERWWDTPTPLYRSTICLQAGPWTNLRLEEDWEYDCRIAALGARLVWCNTFVCEVRDHSGERLSQGVALDKRRLMQRARSHELIYGHAIRAGLSAEVAELQHFARALFLLSRQCGAVGLPAESRRLFFLARLASGDKRGQGLDFKIYSFAVHLLGWTSLGKISCWIDKTRL